MVDFGQVDQFPAHDLADGLFAETDAQDGLAAGIGADDIKEQSGFFGNAGTGRQQNLVVPFEIAQLEPVIADHGDFRAQLFDQMTQVVSE